MLEILGLASAAVVDCHRLREDGSGHCENAAGTHRLGDCSIPLRSTGVQVRTLEAEAINIILSLSERALAAGATN